MWRSPFRFSNILRVVMRQKKSDRYYSLGAVQEQDDAVQYPPVKPKFPPGDWSGLEREYAWQMYHWEQEVLEIPSVEGRIDYIKKLQKSHNKYRIDGQFAWFFDGKSLEPRLLNYQFDKTKTFPIEGLPSIYDNVDIKSDLEALTPVVKDIILSECDKVSRRSSLANPVGLNKEKISKLLIKSLILKILSSLSCSHSHLLTAELSEDVFQQAYWDRYSDRGLLPEKEKPQKKVMKYQGEYKTSFQLRTELPLPEFVGRDSDTCVGQDYPKCPYHPIVLGQRKEKCTPHFLPGVNRGSPCEFGYLSVETVNSFKLDKAAVDYQSSPEIIPELWKGFALSSSFLSTVAQAHYQGFNTYHDMMYPLTSQTIVTDGRKFLFSAYQLNTLHLWKSDESNPVCNLFWHKEMTLFDGVQNGTLVGFNDDVLKTLLQFLVLGTQDGGYNMTPTISDTQPTQTIEDFVPVEEVVERIQHDVDEFTLEHNALKEDSD
ncbi:28S ribosomal protein S30, mitochondrial-like [Pecten maximus]|uniref:28S ribosomal protein S30, mitochondrial-like n=1 Tax=Pecten maximus TaxID=6579 RepID=UPI0014580604|nr:28S ribosomal protein S30, mitochondrial-like [Pecten maximus]XP_033749824.1 28S ribosomal protein S30, mitochondrial-like [Pecten maximus]XP_033749825.1 28S ribosomal protein S30, mitochondrial-like [Pecten maximus]